MHEEKAQLEELQAQIEKAIESLDLSKKKARVAELEKEMQAPGFWDDRGKAEGTSREASHLKELVENWEGMKGEVEELLGLLPSAEDDPKGAEEFRGMVGSLGEKFRKLEISVFLNGKYDGANAILSVHSGTGGTDSQDFAEMLLRMYMRYAEKQGFQAEFLDKSDGEEAGIKSATVLLKGPFAYGYLRCEAGVHRLVRLSPFNSGNTRETSFALIEILPEIHQADHVEIDEKDLKIDVYRSSGHGGQSVNTTDSAVRITHIPTGTVVTCQNERSQLQNKERAMVVLQSRLKILMEKEQAEHLNDLKGGKTEIKWGNQIRSYVLHPYKMVKDHRTGYEVKDTDAVLDGDIQEFIEAELKK